VPRSAVLLALLVVNGNVLENTFARDGCCRKRSTNKISLLPSCGKINASLSAPSPCAVAKCSTTCSLPTMPFRGITHLIAQFLGPSCLEYAVCTWSAGYTQTETPVATHRL
jgi:hypothetical protein